jgi:hypothetical protein
MILQSRAAATPVDADTGAASCCRHEMLEKRRSAAYTQKDDKIRRAATSTRPPPDYYATHTHSKASDARCARKKPGNLAPPLVEIMVTETA